MTCVLLETIVMIYSTQKVSSSIHSVGSKHKERNLYTVMSDNAFNKMDVLNVYISLTGVISKNFNKWGSRHNHAHSLGVAQLQPCPNFQRCKHDNLV